MGGKGPESTLHSAAKGGRQKGIGKKVTKSVTKSDKMVTKR